MSDAGTVDVTVDGGVMTLTLNRPVRRNALTLAMYDTLVAGLEQAEADPSIRVVRLQGAGDHFSSGNDLGDFMANPPSAADSPVFRFLTVLHRFPKPVVAQVRGFVIGIGATMLLHCDLVYADTSAVFQMPFVNLALVPEGGSSILLPRLAGHARASELLLLGERFGADEALGMGMVSRLFAPGELVGGVDGKVAALAARAPEALRLSKELLRGPYWAQVGEALTREAIVFAERLGSAETHEAIAAFFEKRPPDFSRLSEG
jgi:enoyl-CoA hydratase/carnithine racemase